MIEASAEIGTFLVFLGILGVLSYITKCIITSSYIREQKELTGWLIGMAVMFILTIVGYLSAMRYIIWV